MPRRANTFRYIFLGLVTLAVLSMSHAQNTTMAPSHVKTTEEVYQNIKVLKGIPSDELIPGMQFITASLGVECSFCHVENHFERDDKKPKETARKMIRMVMALNRDEAFGNTPKVTCNSCHRGSRLPVSIPAISEQPALPGAAEYLQLANLPAPDQVLSRYVQALGGANAIAALTTLAETGTTLVGNRETTLEIFDQSPDKRVMVIHLPTGESVTAFNGAEGWTLAAHRPFREMPSADLPGEKMDADLQFALKIKDLLGDRKSGPLEKVGGQDVYQLIAEKNGRPAARLYFSKESGLLVRALRYAASPLGLNPTRIDYDDYRPLHGVKIPYRWTIARPFGQLTVQVTKAEANVPIDSRKFEKPLEAEQQSAK